MKKIVLTLVLLSYALSGCATLETGLIAAGGFVAETALLNVRDNLACRARCSGKGAEEEQCYNECRDEYFFSHGNGGRHKAYAGQ